MIDEKRIIAKLEKRIDDFVKANPDQKDGVSVQVIQEFIHMLELEAKNGEDEEMVNVYGQLVPKKDMVNSSNYSDAVFNGEN